MSETLTEAQIDTLERNYLAGLISEQEYDEALDQILREADGRAAPSPPPEAPMSETLTEAQIRALRTVETWHGSGGTYMPFARQQRTFEACERKGLVEWRSVDSGAKYNGYALTDAGRLALKEHPTHD